MNLSQIGLEWILKGLYGLHNLDVQIVEIWSIFQF